VLRGIHQAVQLKDDCEGKDERNKFAISVDAVETVMSKRYVISFRVQ
jgi:hypothetical protein